MIQQNKNKDNSANSSNTDCTSITLLDIPKLTISNHLQHTDISKLQLLQKSNNFLSILNSHLDYLSFTIDNISTYHLHTLLEFIDIKQDIVLKRDRHWSIGHKSRNYENTITSSIGIIGGFSNLNDFHRYEVMIVIQGAYFANLSTAEQQKLICYLHKIPGINITRIDLAIDDPTFKIIPLKSMIKAYRDGNYFYFRKYKKNKNTHYFGSLGKSQKLVRVYPHKSKYLRFETELCYYRHAVAACERIAALGLDASNDEQIQRTLFNLAVSTIDFRDRSKLKNPQKASVSKTKRLRFWQKFVNLMSPN